MNWPAATIFELCIVVLDDYATEFDRLAASKEIEKRLGERTDDMQS